jgi:hypothetical protein
MHRGASLSIAKPAPAPLALDVLDGLAHFAGDVGRRGGSGVDGDRVAGRGGTGGRRALPRLCGRGRAAAGTAAPRATALAIWPEASPMRPSIAPPSARKPAVIASDRLAMRWSGPAVLSASP